MQMNGFLFIQFIQFIDKRDNLIDQQQQQKTEIYSKMDIQLNLKNINEIFQKIKNWNEVESNRSPARTYAEINLYKKYTFLIPVY